MPTTATTLTAPSLIRLHVVDLDEIRAAAVYEVRHHDLSDLQATTIGELYLRAVVSAVHLLDGVAYWLPLGRVLAVRAGCVVGDVALLVTLAVNAAICAPDPDMITGVLTAVLGGNHACGDGERLSFRAASSAWPAHPSIGWPVMHPGSE